MLVVPECVHHKPVFLSVINAPTSADQNTICASVCRSLQLNQQLFVIKMWIKPDEVDFCFLCSSAGI